MAKEFLDYDTVRNNGIKLAARIYSDGFVPDVIYVSLRGGAYLGNVLSECFKMVKPAKPVLYAALVARLYSSIQQSSRLVVDGWTYPPDHLRPSDKILFVDDIFDTGTTVSYAVGEMMRHGVSRENIKVAVHDFKNFDNQKSLSIQPDYWCRKFDLRSRAEDVWIHCMSHELLELSDEELEEFYFSRYPDLRESLEILRNAGKSR